MIENTYKCKRKYDKKNTKRKYALSNLLLLKNGSFFINVYYVFHYTLNAFNNFFFTFLAFIGLGLIKCFRKFMQR